MKHYHDLLPGGDFDCLEAVLDAIHRNAIENEGDMESVFARVVACVVRALPEAMT